MYVARQTGESTAGDHGRPGAARVGGGFGALCLDALEPLLESCPSLQDAQTGALARTLLRKRGTNRPGGHLAGTFPHGVGNNVRVTGYGFGRV